MADQAVLDGAVEQLKRRDQIGHHAAQTYLASRCKLYGTANVVTALREMSALSVVTPRAWLDARLKDHTDGTPFARRNKSAVERVMDANPIHPDPDVDAYY